MALCCSSAGLYQAGLFQGRIALGQRPVEDIAQDADNLGRRLDNCQRRGIYLFQRMLVVCAMHDDQRLAKRRCIACIESRVPLLVFVAKAHNDNIGGGDGIARTDGVQIGTLVVMPELVRLRPQNPNPAIVTCRVIGDRTAETDAQPGRGLGNLVTPVGVDFAGKIDIQGHDRFSLLQRGRGAVIAQMAPRVAPLLTLPAYGYAAHGYGPC